MILAGIGAWFRARPAPFESRSRSGSDGFALRACAQAWGDQFVSVEHMVLAFVDDQRFGATMMRTFNLNQKTLEDAAKALRGSNQVRLQPLMDDKSHKRKR